MAEGDELAIPAPDGVDQGAWDAAVAAVRAYCRWHVAPVITETQAALVHGRTVTLRSLRVLEVTGVTIAGSALSVGGWMLSPESPTLFLAHTPGACRPFWWPDMPTRADVEMSHGYDELPQEIVAICQEAASRGVTGSLFAQVGQVRYGGSGTTPGSASFMLSQQAVLDRYRLAPRP